MIFRNTFYNDYLSIHLHVEGGENYILKRIASRKPDLTLNTWGHVYPYVK